jgi:ferric-dicitrate binding protein FerR (iron transport regulator)
MKNRVIGKILACMLAVMLPAATMSAETHAAMLYATNTVMLNGVGAERSSAVFAGDSIQTPANGAVRLTAEGSTVMVGPLTTLVYEGDAVRLGSGSTMVTTEKGMKTRVQRLQIAPSAQRRTSYRVVRGGGQVMVAALHGSVNVSDGSSSKTVAEGNTTSVPDPGPTPPQGGATPGVSVGSLGGLSGKTAAIILAGVAAGTILLVYETTKTPLSSQ